MKQNSDSALLQLIKENDHNAFDLLFDRYWETLYRAANARLQNEAVSKDIFQEIFIKLWQRRDAFDKGEPLPGASVRIIGTT